MKKIIRDIGRGFYNLFIAIAIVAFLGSAIAVANYTVTQGSGTTFGSIVVSLVHYAQQLLCDPTTPSQCAAVNSSGQVSISLQGANTSVIPPLGQTNLAGGTPVSPASDWVDAVKGQVNVTPNDCSGTITSGGTAQNAIAANAGLHGFTIANIDTSAGSGEPLWISFTTTAAASTAASYPLAAPTATTFANLASFSTPLGFGTNHAVSIIGATTGHKFSCTYW